MILKKIAAILVVLSGLASQTQAQTFEYDQVIFQKEANGFSRGEEWTQIEFRIEGLKLAGSNHLGKNYVVFTLNGSTKYEGRTDIRLKYEAFGGSVNGSNSRGERYLGTDPLWSKESASISNFPVSGKYLLAWIIANSSSLIDYAIKHQGAFDRKSFSLWKSHSSTGRFERKLRSNFSVNKDIAYLIERFDNKDVSDSSQFEIKKLQRELAAALDSPVVDDGKWGSATLAALKRFEAKISSANSNQIVDGILTVTERKQLASYALYSNPQKVANEFASLKDKLASSEKSLRSLAAKSVDYQKEIATLTVNLNAMSQELKDKRLEVQNQKAQISKLFTENAALKLKADGSSSMVAEIENLKGIISKTDIQIKDLESQVSELTAGRLTREKEISKAKIEISAKILEIENLRVQIENLNKSVVDLALLRKEVQSLRGEIESKKDIIQHLEGKASGFGESVSNKEREIARQKEMLAKGDAEIEYLKNENLKLNKEIESLRVNLKVNEGSSRNNFALSDEWTEKGSMLSPQQMRFCQILHNYGIDAEIAQESKNQLKMNNLILERDRDINALLPSGRFSGWIAKADQIFAVDGGAAYRLRTPCNDVTIGSGFREENGVVVFEGLVFPGLIYSQLAQLSVGDLVLINGKLISYEEEITENNQPRFMSKLESSDIKSVPVFASKLADHFVEIDYLSKLE